LNRAKTHVRFHQASHPIEATQFPDSSIFVTFNALEGIKDAEIPQNGGTEPLLALDQETEDLPAKLEAYMLEMAPTFYENEMSTFMKPTLQIASELAATKKDALLGRVLELWNVNHVLVDDEMRWHTFSLPSGSHSSERGHEERTPINDETDNESYQLLCAQLRSAAEKRAAAISKHVMNELERRLLQRAQSGWFETFLVALILLNCVERSSWLFHSWDEERWATKWPLDRRPPYYFEQGERFAVLMQMLLRMRGGVPETHLRDDGTVWCEGDREGGEVARGWFEKVQLSSEYLTIQVSDLA
jgi:hypothetical protein